MLKIVIDTNMFLVPGQFGVDIFSEFDRILDRNYRLYTLESVLEELERLTEEEGKDSKNARMALDMIEANQINILGEGDRYVDEELLQMGREENTIIATNDGELIRELRKENNDVIRLRQGNKLAIEGKKFI